MLEVLCGLAARQASENIGYGNGRELLKAATYQLTRTHLGGGTEQFMADRVTYYRVMLDIANNAELNRAMPLPQVALLRSQYHGLLTERDVLVMRKE